MRGRKPKPTYLKLVTGNPGKRAINRNEPQPRRQLVRAPDELSDDAKVEWKRIAPELYRMGLLTVADRATFAAYCEEWGVFIVAQRALAKMAELDPMSGALMIKTEGGTPIQNPLVGTAHRARRAMVAYAAEFGMTPSARSRLQTGAGADLSNPFAEFGC
jgi:P27 family predicted phage terminase small subunit